MKKFIVFMLFTMSLLVGCVIGDAQKGGVNVVALNEYVTENKIERRIQSLESLNSKQSLDKENIRANAIEQLIDDYILMYEAKTQGFSVSDEEVQEVIEFNIEMANEAQNENFHNLLNEMNMTVEEYYKEYAYESMKGKLLENKLYDDITSKGEEWNEFKKKVINEFREKNDTQIKNLLEKVN
ncbi:SurA N-terminal domain-containing protein [Rossellomorea aquimaris]|uniref:SurA N-terminal domain-containing protein n=1 Tax=Rossellomorea aquimaris TaxID=189382 RepID=UPI003CE6DA60